MKYVLNTMNFPFLLTSLPLNVITSLLCVVNLPCQLEIEIPLLCIMEDPLPDAFPLGNGSIPFISAVQELSLSAILLIGSSETIYFLLVYLPHQIIYVLLKSWIF